MRSEAAWERRQCSLPTQWAVRSGVQHGRPEKLEKMKSLGLDHGIDTSHEDFAETVKSLSGGRGVDVLIDLLGGGVALERNLAASRRRADWCWSGFLGGSHAPLDLNLMLRKRLTMVGTTLRAPTARGKDHRDPGASPHRSSPGSSVDSYARSWIRSSRLRRLLLRVRPVGN